ncbi:MAG: CPA2 family monovalent cation:H+ antiporter-2 [Sulfurimonas sp.]|jgi:CPA2 family monovalent cation:H+ antiporter-2|uniref:cation:proton antiporter domain-containing protein n=1 Tax=Sulfurimonas sp. TaxID=2022749 RepID=UPI0039E329FF
MENTILYVISALGISIVINIFLKKIGVSQIIGYIMTGTIIVYAFDLKEASNSHTLGMVGEFGIVFLMFTIGLEISLAKMGVMKKEIFVNGFLQATSTALLFFAISHLGFSLSLQASIIISTAFALSSTAVVLSYLKSSKEIYKPYGQISTGILIFQDLAVIPLLILIGFMTTEAGESIFTIITDTLISVVIVLLLLFIVGKKIMTWLLHFSASSEVEELFMGSVLFIVVAASLFAHYMGFTYSLGAFIAGMIIAETKYHHKVESDIAPFKDLLLGTFFVVVGMKIDILYFIDNVGLIVGIFLAVFILKSIVTYAMLRFTSRHRRSLKAALALSQVGEFSFVIFALASMGGLMDEELAQLLVLVVIFSMIVTPFFIAKIGPIVELFSGKIDEVEDMSALSSRKNHVVVCGYGVVGKYVTHYLDDLGASYVIIDNSHKHVKEALNDGHEAYLGDASKESTLDAIHIDTASSVVVTLDNAQKKKLVCEAISKHTGNANLVVKVVSLEEKEMLKDLNITVLVDGKIEVARVLVERMLSCQLKYK